MLDLILGLHLISHHAPAREDYNNTNPGIYARTPDGWTVGIYRNSFNRTSVYAGKAWTASWPRGDASFLLGAVSGYQRELIPDSCQRENVRWGHHRQNCFREVGFSSSPLTLLAVPSLRYEFVRLSWLPRVGHEASVLHLSVERGF
jgi:hypothetical protein